MYQVTDRGIPLDYCNEKKGFSMGSRNVVFCCERLLRLVINLYVGVLHVEAISATTDDACREKDGKNKTRNEKRLLSS